MKSKYDIISTIVKLGFNEMSLSQLEKTHAILKYNYIQDDIIYLIRFYSNGYIELCNLRNGLLLEETDNYDIFYNKLSNIFKYEFRKLKITKLINEKDTY